MRDALDLGQMIGRLGMTIVLMISGAYWLLHREFQLALLSGILMSLIDLEGKFSRLKGE